ncbi:MAG: response regulator [Bdellovibrionales bacterium]
MKKRVMIVDDAAFIHEVLGRYLEKFDLDLLPGAKDGKEAIELCRKNRPNIIFMDMAMPNMNGVDATRRILDEYPDVRVVAVSSMPDAEIIDQALAAGCIEFIDKSFSVDIISEIIEKVLNPADSDLQDVVNG